MKSLYKLAVVLLFGLSLQSCESLVEDLNTDPNNPTDASARYIFTGTQIANMAAQEGMASRLTIVWTGYGKGTFQQFGNWYLYSITANNFDADWNLFYTGANKNALIAIEKAEALGNRIMVGIVKIIQAHAIGTASELWGDVPFSEASNIALFPNPRFEPQQELFPKLLTQLDDAILDLQSGIGTVGAEDIHFGGEVTRWIEVAYTLKARYLMDLKDYQGAYEAASNGVSRYQNSMYAPHGTTINADENANYSFLTNVRAGSITAEDSYNADLLNPSHAIYRGNAKTDETARFNFYYLEDGVNAVGVIEPNTLTTATARGFFARDASFPLITYQENILSLAECALRSGAGSDVALGHLNEYRAFLNNGGYLDPTYMTNSTFSYEPYTLGDFESGGIENLDGVSAENALLREIIEERYVTFYGQHIGWNDERRTRNEEVLRIPLTPNIGDRLPGRFIYSQNELNSNSSSPSPVPDLFDAMSIYQ